MYVLGSNRGPLLRVGTGGRHRPALDESLRLDVGSMTPFLSDFLPRSKRVRPSAGPMINSATKQSILLYCCAMDCIASLAMTVSGQCPPGAVIEPARDLMLRADSCQRRSFEFAAVHHIPTAGVERASRWRIDRARHIPVDHRLEALHFGVRYRHGGQQCLGIGMAGVCEQFGLPCNLDDAPEIHYRDAVADMGHHSEIMGDEQI